MPRVSWVTLEIGKPQPAQSHIEEGRSMAEYRAYVPLVYS